MKRVNKQAGFTLIELVIVIVILGILAVTAAPKFISMTDEANEAAVLGLKGGMAAAMQITYARSTIEGEEGDEGDGVIGINTGVITSFGYPTATEDGILDAMEIDAVVGDDAGGGLTGEFVYAIVDGADPAQIVISSSSMVADDDEDGEIDSVEIDLGGCYVTYTEAVSGIEGSTVVTTC